MVKILARFIVKTNVRETAHLRRKKVSEEFLTLMDDVIYELIEYASENAKNNNKVILKEDDLLSALTQVSTKRSSEKGTEVSKPFVEELNKKIIRSREVLLRGTTNFKQFEQLVKEVGSLIEALESGDYINIEDVVQEIYERFEWMEDLMAN